ncbi:TPA: hypothetical protein ACIO8I_003390, partial [Salmonella enterica subsp. enterica serovar Lexington]
FSEEAHPSGWAFLRSDRGMYCRMAAPPYPAYRNYPAYEAGVLVEPTRVHPTQSLTMNYPLHVLI